MLEMEQVKKKYGDFLLDASLHVRPGMISALVGPNGAGKSTLFKAAMGRTAGQCGCLASAVMCRPDSSWASCFRIRDSAVICG